MLSLYAALLACSEQKVTINRQPPEVSLVAPADSSTFLVDQPVTFEAVVRDEDALEALVFTWSSDVQGAVEGELSFSQEYDLIAYTTSDLAVGEHTVRLQVTDTDAAEASDSVTITVVAEADADGDGYDDEALGGDDCDDADADVNPGAAEVPYDGADNDCDEATPDDDLDGDGFVLADDCDDTDEDVFPDAEEIWYDGVDQDCDGGGDYDQDGDGFDSDAHGGGDCDDEPATGPPIHPDAEEVCDGLDNDCDGVIDGPDADGAAVWYLDLDEDGFGGETSAVSCEPPEGYVGISGDCDDTDPAVTPKSPETTYNGADDDCDPLTPDDDLDGDSFPLAEDCDDADADVNPDAVEICDDSIDQDCDGEAPACLLLGTGSNATADAAFYGETNNDYVGWILAGAGDTDGDSCGDLIIGAPDAGSPGTAYLVRGCSMVGEASLADAGAVILGADNNDELGAAVAGADLDGDGVSELLISAPADEDSGAIWLFSAPEGALSAGDAAGSVSASGGGGDDRLGHALDASGDIDGDGIADLVVAAPGADPYESREGAGVVAVFLSPGIADLDIADADFTLQGAAEGDGYGAAVAVADVDGDGLDDVAAGAPLDASAGRDAGAIYVFLASELTGTHASDQADVSWLGERNDAVGRTLAAGDLDGDGAAELVVGVPELDEPGDFAGAAFVLPGGTAGGEVRSDAVATLRGEAGDLLGESLAIGDVDGDGLGDLLVGARGAYGESRYAYGGEAALFYGLPGVLPSGELALSDGDWHVLGDTDYARLGGGVALPGDLSGDGPGEIVLGAPHWSGGTLAGAVFVFEGGGI